MTGDKRTVKTRGLRLVKADSPISAKLHRREKAELLPWQPLNQRREKLLFASTREEWLTRLTDGLRGFFESIGYPIPTRIRVTCGWPSRAGLGRVRKRIGECWPASASADKTVEVFISPCLDDAITVGATLAHELIHATGIPGHRGRFPRVAKEIGLLKPWRATTPTELLKERLNALIQVCRLGPYPHAQLGGSNPLVKKDRTRMQKLVCPIHGYTVRTSQKWIDFGLPRCPCGLHLVRPNMDGLRWLTGRSSHAQDDT